MDATTQAIEEGLSREATARRIRTLVNGELKGNINVWRSRRIAQTERVAAGNYGIWQGQIEAVNNGAMIKRKWIVRGGAETPRHELCTGLDGQLRGLNEPFDVCGEPLMYPGDPSGSAGNVINCYCNVDTVADINI
jgi:hypothetical protein